MPLRDDEEFVARSLNLALSAGGWREVQEQRVWRFTARQLRSGSDIAGSRGQWEEISREIRRTLIEMLSNQLEIGFEETFELHGSSVSISGVARRPGGEKRIVGIVTNANASAEILVDAQAILKTTIDTKAKKCVNINGPVWLALLNDYWLADADTWSRAMDSVAIDHPFDRIYLVTTDGGVVLLGGDDCDPE